MAEFPTRAASPRLVGALIAAMVSHTRVAKSRSRGARVARRGGGSHARVTDGSMEISQMTGPRAWLLPWHLRQASHGRFQQGFIDLVVLEFRVKDLRKTPFDARRASTRATCDRNGSTGDRRIFAAVDRIVFSAPENRYNHPIIV